MKNKQSTSRGFLTGILTMALIFGLASPAGAALTSKTIQVLTGAEIYIDGIKLEPKDANGKPVETFVYNGTTYVPLRAVSQSLGKNVNWDGEKQRVYIGEAPGVKQYLPSIMEPYQSSRYYDPTTATMAGTKYANIICLGAYSSGGWALYNLNGQYRSLSFDMGHNDGDEMRSGTINVYLDGELTFSADMDAEDLPKHFTVPLHNALQMKLETTNGYYRLANVEIY